MEIGVQSSQHSKIDSRLALAEMAVSLQLSAKVPAKSCRKTKKENRDMAIVSLSFVFKLSFGLGSGQEIFFSGLPVWRAGWRRRKEGILKTKRAGCRLDAFCTLCPQIS